MTVSITIKQNMLLEDDGSATVTTLVTSVTDIDTKIFVLTVDNDTYQRVAMAWDMINIPNTKEQAQNSEMQIYRSNTGSKNYTNIDDSLTFKEEVKTRVAYLATQWQAYSTEFEEEEINTYTG